MPVTSSDSGGGISPLVITPLPTWPGLRLAGEVDVTNHEKFRSALDALPAEGAATLHLDVGGLSFIDVGGTRALLALADARPHQRIILHGPPASFRRLYILLRHDVGIEIHDDTGGRPVTVGR